MEVIVGEGNITRREFYEELDYWEVMRIYHGIQRRYRSLYDTSRTRDFMYLSAHWDTKNGPAPASPMEWCPHSWDPVIDKEWKEREDNAALEIIRAANRAQREKEGRP